MTLGEQPSLGEKLAKLLKSLTSEPQGFTEISAAPRSHPDRMGRRERDCASTSKVRGAPEPVALCRPRVALKKK
jgi:hypothetical protein